MKKTYLVASLLVSNLLLAPVLASADTMTFDIAAGNTALSGYAGPYVSVEIDRADSTHATITFTSLTNAGNIYLMGDGGSVAVNVNAATWTLASITGTQPTGFTAAVYSDDGSKNVSDFGVFNQVIKSFDGYTQSSNSIILSLVNNSGTWDEVAAVLTNNSAGYMAAAHIFVAVDPASSTAGALTTGFAGNGDNPPVPEPASMLLFGTGIIGLTSLGRKKRN